MGSAFKLERRARASKALRQIAVSVLLWTLLGLEACASTPSAQASRLPAFGEMELIREGLTIRSIARDAWVVTHEEAHHSNVLVVRFPDGTVVLCSSPFDAATARELLSWIHARLAPLRVVAINTHWHLDGTGGNAAYREAGVSIYASTHTQALSLERGARMRQLAAEDLPTPLAERVRATPIVGAEHTFDESTGLTLVFGGERVEVMYPGAAHSQDNVVVYLPDRGILFGGCMLKVGNSLGYLGDASLNTWEQALTQLAKLGATTVVPGHGRAGGAEMIGNTKRLVQMAIRLAEPNH